jgi:hypothetical protein
MEVLGAVSSVFAVVSLAVQLNSNIQQLIEFWDSIQDAPIEVARIKTQLRVLTVLLQSIELEGRRTNADDSDSGGAQCLCICLECVKKVEKLTVELDRGLNGGGIRRKWTRLKKTFKEKELNQYWEELERAKTLLIVYQGWRNRLVSTLTHACSKG